MKWEGCPSSAFCGLGLLPVVSAPQNLEKDLWLLCTDAHSTEPPPSFWCFICQVALRMAVCALGEPTGLQRLGCVFVLEHLVGCPTAL